MAVNELFFQQYVKEVYEKSHTKNFDYNDNNIMKKIADHWNSYDKLSKIFFIIELIILVATIIIFILSMTLFSDTLLYLAPFPLLIIGYLISYFLLNRTKFDSTYANETKNRYFNVQQFLKKYSIYNKNTIKSIIDFYEPEIIELKKKRTKPAIGGTILSCLISLLTYLFSIFSSSNESYFETLLVIWIISFIICLAIPLFNHFATMISCIPSDNRYYQLQRYIVDIKEAIDFDQHAVALVELIITQEEKVKMQYKSGKAKKTNNNINK